MKILQINTVYAEKSTGRIAKEIADIQIENSIIPYAVCGEGHFDDDKVYVMGSKLYQKVNILMTRLFGRHGFYNKSATRKMLRWVDKVKPDIIHLHNIHGHYMNIKLLFEYIKKHDIPVVWTLHDCWSFTGHCSHFDYIGCDKWKTGCHHCTMQHSYPISWFFDRSKDNYKAKKELFTNVRRMHITTPSNWLKNLCEKSFLGEYPVTTLYNGIEPDVFCPTESDLRKKLGIEDKFVILGIVDKFSGPKGGEHFLTLSRMLKEDEVIVLLTLSEAADKIPSNIIALPRTSNDKELAQIYSMADVFVNPTLQETFSMTNLESIACNTPVATFATGGCTESLNEKCGIWVPRGDVKGLYEAVQKIRGGAVNPDDCRDRALEFNVKESFSRFIDIYKDVL